MKTYKHNKIYVGGLGSLSDFFEGHPCNLNIDRVLLNPSMFLWNDCLILPQKAFDNITKGKDKQHRLMTTMLQKLDNRGMLNVIDYGKIYNKEAFDELYDKAQNEIDLLSNCKEIKYDGDEKTPKMIMQGGCYYCAPKIASIYASIKIANESDAACILNKSEIAYLENNAHIKKKYYDYNNIVSKIIEVDLPVFDDMLKYVSVNEDKCKMCTRENKCESECIEAFETCFDQILDLHEHDAMFELRNIVDSIIFLRYQISTESDINDMAREYKEKKDKANRMLHSILPKVKKWSSFALFLGFPLSLMTKIPPALTTALPGMVGAAADYMVCKNNWVSIVDDLHNITYRK